MSQLTSFFRVATGNPPTTPTVRRTSCLLLLFAFCVAAPGAAQTNIESNAGIQLDFVNPGARSLALGGAFVGLADDATAALTNPAGLRFISRKEISAEGRHWGFNTPFTSGGRLAGNPTLKGIDQTGGLTVGESRESTTGASFLSFVYPSARWALAAYRQQLSDFRYAAESQGPFVQLQNSAEGRLFPYRATLDLRIARYGVSGSHRIGDVLSVGAGVVLYDFSMSSDAQRFAFNRNSPELYNAPNFSLAPVQQDSQHGRAYRGAVNIGVTATPSSRVEFGAVYRQGAHFEVTTTDITGGRSVSSATTFSVPDIFAFGVALHPLDPLKVTLDYDRVRYSQIADHFVPFFAATPGFSAQSSDFKVDDANEVHVGVEYVLLNLSRPVAIRLGSWYDPDHAVRYEPANSATADPYDLAVFRRGRSVIHGTGGMGVVVGRVEIGAAGDFSARSKTVSVSTIVRF